MKIRSATINDIPDIINIYDELISIEEKGAGKTGWIRGYILLKIMRAML